VSASAIVLRIDRSRSGSQPDLLGEYRSFRPPLYDPSEVIDMTARIHRRKTVTGLISEYRRAA
jgi:hypothetical protein